MSEEIEVTSVAFDERSVQLSYVRTADVKDIAGVPVIMHHQLVVHRGHPSYADGVQAVVDALEELVLDVLEDYADARSWVPPEDEDEDDDRGMGYGD